jgi:hypothetical protein
MKIVKYLSAALLLIFALSETIPIYLIASGLLLGQGGESTMYFFGKLSAHVLFLLFAAVLAKKLYQSAGKTRNEES